MGGVWSPHRVELLLLMQCVTEVAPHLHVPPTPGRQGLSGEIWELWVAVELWVQLFLVEHGGGSIAPKRRGGRGEDTVSGLEGDTEASGRAHRGAGTVLE